MHKRHPIDKPKHGRERGFSRRHPRHKHSSWFTEMIARRGPKMVRGETRYLLMDALGEKGRHGYDIMQAIEEKTGGMYRPSPGTVYPVLQALEDLKLISSSVDGNRKVYELTAGGRQELDSKQSLLEDIYEDMNHRPSPEQDDFFEETQEQLTRMLKSISRSFQRGQLNADKVDEIRGVILDAVRNVDAVLKN